MGISATNFRTQSNYSPAQTKQQAAFSGKPNQQQVKEVIRMGIGSLPGAGLVGTGIALIAAGFTTTSPLMPFILGATGMFASNKGMNLAEKGANFAKKLHWNKLK